ncbi:uncharacterized protein LOC133531507 [Cydia pomonella]|uniref:uncharacterized protein LOC133531507 n=1 Tax=Cydia pomonella TaxID=82600 RepID=UPI002ADE0D53|nr:uncharacterized protein LOC133531507 [Cydia pomonella]
MSSYTDIAESQKSLETRVQKMLAEFEAKLHRSPAAKATVTSLSEEFSIFKEQILSLMKLLGNQIKSLSHAQDVMEMRHRRKYLLFNGVPEDPAETVSLRIADIITDQLKISGVSTASFKACHRLGKPSEGRNRPILVRFTDMDLKSTVWQKKTSCKGTTYAISEFLTPQRQALFVQARKAFGMRSCWSIGGNIFVKLTSGRRERIESNEDVERLKPLSDNQQPRSSSTPDSGAAGAKNADAVLDVPSNQTGRPRRAGKS